jgi:hypothetical protein
MTVNSEAPEITVERIEARMVELSSQIAGATCELLLLVGEYDAREVWRPWGWHRLQPGCRGSVGSGGCGA